MTSLLLRLGVVGLATTALAACSSASGGSQPAGGSTAHHAATGAAPGAITGKLTVFAASSLTEAFGTIATAFQRQHPGVHVQFDFDASSTLAEQITQGAPADVFASAAPSNMQQVVQAKDAGAPTDFARNQLEIAVPPKNPGSVRSIADLARSGVKVAVCQPQVPCGAIAEQLFERAKITVKPTTEEPDVKSTLQKVELGEVDAGVVYVTDVRAAAGKVIGIRVPARLNVATTYPIARLRSARNPAAAAAFVRFVLSPAGRKVLAADGFLAP
jgi:molybdate transport system substrate-binding protein